ncbi:unnamed protein product [Closterium sp. NIES-53]
MEPSSCPFLHCSPVSGGSVRLIVRSSPPLVLYEVGEYRCPPRYDGHYHHSYGSARLHGRGRHLATFTCRPGSSLYTLATEPPQIAAFAQSLPPLPPSLSPPCLPCVKGRQRADPHSSLFPPTTAPLQTLHMDVWGPALVSGQGRERYFLLVVDDYTRYTMVYPLCSKGEFPDVLIPLIHAVHLQLRERFRQDLPVGHLHSDRGGEFSSGLLQDFCRGEGILQTITLLASPQQNGIAERRIGLVMEVASTSMIHAAAPHFPWPFAVRYAAHQLNFLPRVSLPKTSPTLRWSGKVGNASVFRVWSSRAFVSNTSADKLSSCAIPCVFLGFSPDAHGWQFYNPTWHRVLPSHDVTFDESVPFYRVFPYRSAPLPPPPLFLAPGPPLVDPLPPQGPAPSGVSQVDPLHGTVPVEITVDSGVARGAVSGGAALGGAEPAGTDLEGAGSGGAEPGGAEPRGAESEGAESGGTEPRGGAGDSANGGTGAGGTGATSLGGARAPGPGGTGAAGAGGVAGVGAEGTGFGAAGGSGAAGPRAARTGGTRAAGASGVAGVGAGDLELETPELEALTLGVLGLPSSTGLPPPLMCPPPDQSQPPLKPASPFPAPSPYTEQTRGLTERREPVSRRALYCVLLPSPPVSSLADGPDPESDLVRAVSPTVPCLLATVVSDPSFESAAASSLVAELCAVRMNVLEDRQEDFECLAVAVPHLVSMLIAPEGDPDAPDILTPHSYEEEITVPPLGANIVDGMWISRVKRPPGLSPAFKARYMTSLRVLLHVAAQRDYELHSRYFSTPFLQSSLHEEIWLRRPPGFTGVVSWFTPSTTDPSLFLCTDTSLPPFYVLVYIDNLVFAPADTEALTLVKSFSASASSTPRHSPLLYLPVTHSQLHLRTSPILARYVATGRHRPEHWEAAKRVLRYLCSTSGMELVLGGRGPVVLIGHADASWLCFLAVYPLSSVLSSSCEAEIYVGAMAAQELRWLTYLLTDLGERPRSSPVLYIDNKAMIALCQEHRVEHRTKHITLHYFLARELQQSGQLRVAYVATRANTTDIFTKVL